MSFLKKVTFAFLTILICNAYGQVGQEFWFAAPDVTIRHNGETPIQLRLATFENSADVRIEIPANNTFTPIDITIPANTLFTQDLSPFVRDIETFPFDSVRNTGIHITSTTDITAYYELNMTNNPDIFALKGNNALGTEFYVPFQNLWPNQNFSEPRAYAQFNIVATEDNTTIFIFPSKDLLNHSANIPYSITLNKGESYSNRSISIDAIDRPTGTVISSNKPIAVTYGDDSVRPTGFGCYDFYGDQLVPTDIIGSEYILNSNNDNLNPDELAIIVATENFTVLNKNGVQETVLFAGQTYIDVVEDPSVYYAADKPFYLIQITGFGCEIGSAILPPLNCAGSSQVSFARSTSEAFFLSILIPSGSEDDFELDGDSTLIQASDFTAVPGTAGEWLSTFKQFTTAQVADNSAHLVTNSSDVFSLGVVNGGAASGTRFGYFSLFQATVNVEAGPDQSICKNNDTIQLNGNVSGGANSGRWFTTNGSGSFDDDEDLNTFYVPSISDLALGSIEIILESTGKCFVEYDTLQVTFTEAPTSDAGADQSICENNSDITLSGQVTIAAGGQWSGGNGTFTEGNTDLNQVYRPTNAEVSAGELTLYLTTIGNGNCKPVIDSTTVTFTPAPVVSAGSDISICSNNAEAQLAGSVTNDGVSSQGVWSNGDATVSPSNNALTGIYTPTATEISNGSVNLILTSTNNGNCNAESDTVQILITPRPTANAGTDQVLCENNSVAQLSGQVTVASGGQWTGGFGTFTPDQNNLNATYEPTQTELNNGSVTLTLETTGNGNCTAVQDQITINYTDAPTVEAGSNQNICKNNPDVDLSAAITIASAVQWTGGSGSFDPSNTTTTTYTPTQGEIDAGSLKLFAVSTGNGNCNAVTDSLEITFTPAPLVNAGSDLTTCGNNADAQLAGSVTIGGIASQGIWSNGLGFVTPSSNALSGIYTPTATEISNGSLSLILTSTNNGNCNAESDTVGITITPTPTVNAGIDQIVCANNSQATLSGSVTEATGGQWKGGLGTFTPNRNSLNVVYTPTQDEISLGSVTLTLETTGNGTCNPVQDQVTISYTSAPTLEAGLNQTVCGNDPDVNLSATITVATGVQWSGGAGVFNPSSSSASTNYTPTAAEISNGTVKLFATSTGNGNCLAVTDSIEITITAPPTVDAGSNITACENNATVQLDGSFTVSGGIQWSGGAGSFQPNANNPNAQYIPTTTEINNGSVNLTITTINNGKCQAVQDNVLIVFNASPTANAGADQILCANNADVSLNGAITLASGGAWSGGLGSFTPDETELEAVYTPTQSELNAGVVTLRLTTTGNGTCNSEFDEVQISFTEAPTVEAGLNQTVCSNNADVNLDGAVTIASGGRWSGGTGTFNVSNTDLDATYSPSSTEITNGSVTLTLSSTGNGNCNVVTDQVTIDFSPSPFVNAGEDQIVCVDDLDIQLGGFVSGATTTGQWSTSGTGIFVPNPLDVNAVYRASSQDSLNGSITLTLTSTNNGTCLPVQDDLVVTITTGGNANAGADITTCANNSSIQLSGNVSGGAITGFWSTSGTGEFSPNNQSLNAVYTPSAADTANGSITLTLTANSCDLATDELVINLTPAPFVNAGQDQIVCSDNLDIQLDATISGASTTGSWTTSGTGSFSPSNNTIKAIYQASAIDSIIGEVELVLTPNNIGDCQSTSDTLSITISPAGVVDAGDDTTICATNTALQLEATLTSGATGGQWQTRGSGSFNPDNNILNPTYVPSSTDIGQGEVWLVFVSNSCDNATDSILVTITPAPTVDAGLDATVCRNNRETSLSGTITNAPGGQWSTSGNGSFSLSIDQLNNTYIPGITEDSVWLYLTSEPTAVCQAVQDSLLINVTPSPEVNAGPDQQICSNVNTVSLAGEVSGGTTSGIWSTLGTGGFAPSNVVLTANYILSSADSASGSVALVLTSTSNGNCLAETDTMVIDITIAANVIVGNDTSLCQNNSLLPLTATISGGATGGTWSTSGTGTFDPSNSTINTTYVPSEDDLTNGNVTITFTSNSCNSASDQLEVNFTPSPFVDAGENLITCVSDLDVQMNGVIAGASSTGVWSTNGTGTFTPNAQTLNAIYNASSQDSLLGVVELVLEATNIGTCKPVSDTIELRITTGGTADVGSDISVCANNSETQLNAVVGGGANGGTWTTTGTGTFSPNAVSLTPIYLPSDNDRANGSVVLTFTSNGCDLAADDLILTITPAPTVEAGTNQVVCANNSEVNLSGQITVAGGGQWTTTNGSFSNSQDLNAVYTPRNGDTVAVLYLTSVNNGNCLAVRDSLILNITESPVVNAGNDLLVCSDQKSISLSGNVTGRSTTGRWLSLGTGTFTPSNQVLEATYLVSQFDSASGGVELILLSTNNGNCLEETDTLKIAFEESGFVNAGSDQTICQNNDQVTLNATISGSTSGIQWTTNGDGVFSNNTALSTTYQPGVQDSIAGTIEINIAGTACNNPTDQLLITLTEAPLVDAGESQNICFNDLEAQLSGSVTSSTNTGIWSTSGNGTFSPDPTDLNATYTLSATDSAIGQVLLTLKATNIGNCALEEDQITIRLTGQGAVNAGVDREICESENVQLSVSKSGSVTEVTWSTLGTGVFQPNNVMDNPTYILSNQDIANGSVRLVVAGNSCDNPFDTINVVINPGPNAEAGNNQSVCANNTEVSIFGSVVRAGGGFWTTSGSGTFDNTQDQLSNSYLPSQEDIENGSVVLKLITTDNGGCVSDEDSMLVTITDAPNVSGGIDQQVCKSSSFTELNGFITGGSTSGIWVSLGDGSITPDPQDLNAQYIFGEQDTLNGFVRLVLTSTNNGNCASESDTLRITFGEKAFVSVGEDVKVCRENLIADIEGTISGGATQGIWQSSGTGTFVNGNTAIANQYVFSETDSIAGSVNLILATVDHGDCEQSFDTLNVSIFETPQVDIGQDLEVCIGQRSVLLNAQVTGTGDISWFTNGTGSFTSASNINTEYVLSPIDQTLDSIAITASLSDQTGCAAPSDQLIIRLTNPITADFISTNNCTNEFTNLIGQSQVNTGVIESFRWVIGDTTISSSSIPQIKFPQAGVVSVKYVVKSNLGCSDSITKDINVFSPPTAGFSVADEVVFDEEFQITDLSSIDAIDHNYYINEDTLFESSPIYIPTVSGDLDILQVVFNQNGCSDSALVTTLVVIENVFPPVLPSAFTPNGDGNNDVLYVRGGPFQEIEFSVYNQWGNRIFYTTSIGEGWDGQFKGKEQPIGGYLYTVKAKTIDGADYKISGEINLIK